MGDLNSEINKEILNKFGSVLIDQVHSITCQNIRSMLSGYYDDPESTELFCSYSELNDLSKDTVHKLLLHAVNRTMSNFLQCLSQYDELDGKNTVLINSYYADDLGRKRRIVDMYENLSALFTNDWLGMFATFKIGICPDNPRNISLIKVLPNSNEPKESVSHVSQHQDNKLLNNLDKEFDFQCFLEKYQAQIENHTARIVQDAKSEERYNSGSLYLISYLSQRFPSMTNDQWNDIEAMGKHDGNRFSDMFDIALECETLDDFISQAKEL